MKSHKAIAKGLILLLPCTISNAQSRTGKDRADTVAGEIRIVQISVKKTEVRLSDKTILTVVKKRLPRRTDFNEISIYDVVKHRMPPFDQVVIFNNWAEHFTGCGPGVFFLGLKKNGTYRFSRSTPNCIDRKIEIKKDRVVIEAVADVHTTEYMYFPIPGGKWVYRNGVLHTVKLIILPDPRAKR